MLPFGPPDDALAGTARYLIERGRLSPRRKPGAAKSSCRPGSRKHKGSRSYAQWRDLGVMRADGTAVSRGRRISVHLRVPVSGGPAFLLGQNFTAVMSYNPAFSYALAVCYLADRIRGAGPFVQPFPGGERTPTLAEVQEIQRRLTAARLRHRRHRWPGRPRHHAGGAGLSAQGRHDPGGWLSRRRAAGAVAPGRVIGLDQRRFHSNAGKPNDRSPRATPPPGRHGATAADADRCERALDARSRRRQRAGVRQRRRRRRAARPQRSLYRAQSRRELSRPARLHRQLSRQLRRRRCCCACMRRPRSRLRTATPRSPTSRWRPRCIPTSA